MKKCAWILAFICLLSLISCGNETNVAFQGKIIEISDEAMLVEPLSSYSEAKHAERINVAIQYMPSSPEPMVGDIIEVTYNGIMMEEKPPWPCGITKVVIVEHAVSDVCDNTAVNGDVMESHQAFGRVILSGDSFVDIYDGTISEKTIDDLYKVGSDLEMLEANRFFAIVDLNGDGVSEVVLSLAMGNNEYPYGFAILHYGEDGLIRCYHKGYREFHELKTDGTFWSSGGANDWAICSIDSFGLENVIINKDMWCQSTSENGNLEVSFYHRGVQLDESTFFDMVEEHQEKADVTFRHISEFEGESVGLVS